MVAEKRGHRSFFLDLTKSPIIQEMTLEDTFSNGEPQFMLVSSEDEDLVRAKDHARQTIGHLVDFFQNPHDYGIATRWRTGRFARQVY